MRMMMMSCKKWIFLIIMLILTNLSPLVTSQQLYGCFSGNYTSNSTYSTNLISLLSSLPLMIGDAGFFNASNGSDSDSNTAFASALCRGDSQLDTCRSCVRNATAELLTLCSNRRQGVVFKEFCTVRYSDRSMYAVLSDVYLIRGSSTENVSNPDEFRGNLRSLLEELRGKAAAGGSAVKVAAGNRSASTSETIFALLQCSPDLGTRDCSNCLEGLVQRVPICCDGSNFVRLLVPSCNVQFGIEPFYNVTRIEEVRATVVYVFPPVPAPAPAFAPGLVPFTPTPPPGKGNKKKTRTIIFIVVPMVLGLVLGVFLSIFLRKSSKKKPQEIIQNYEEISTVESLLYDFAKIEAATNNFSDTNKLGEGGFGIVYKGKLQNGREIAVKRLSKNSRQGEEEFKNEVLLMAKLEYRNLVRLLGFSLKEEERILIYEFLQNGSLDGFIFDPIKRLLIDWNQRYKIIKQIAKALLYLHDDSGFRIIHRDLKAGNILLDKDMHCKIADFGMARLFLQDESGNNYTERIAGTFGYMAPEYARHGQISTKLDVFSFGVLILEIVSGQKNGSFRNPEDKEKEEFMLSFAWRRWREGAGKTMIDPVLMSASTSVRDMLRCIHIALLCVQDNAADRPHMASVVVMLSSVTVTLPVPSKPAYFMRSSLVSDPLRENEVSISLESRNDASITELYPR